MVVKQWQKSPREAVESPLSEILKTQQDLVLTTALPYPAVSKATD